MNNAFGPWSTSIDSHHGIGLSAFWNSRITQLPQLGRRRSILSRRDFLAMSTAALAMGGLPTVLRSVEPAEEVAANKKPAKPRKGRIFVQVILPPTDPDDASTRFRGFISVDPESGKYEKLGTAQGRSLRVSPDGQTIAYRNKDALWTNNLRGDSPGRIANFSGSPIWSPDSKQIVVSHGELIRQEDEKQKREKPAWKIETWMMDIFGENRVRLDVPETDYVNDWSPDGKWFVTWSDRHPPYGSGYQLYVMRPDGTEERRLTKDPGLNGGARFSPDSRRIVYTYQRKGETNLHMINVDGTGHREITHEPDIGPHACWSPDGKKLAVVIFDWTVEPDGTKSLGDFADADFRVVVMDADGSNAKRLDLPKGRYIKGSDWA